jgi:NAD-dependent dihydropyrimidine dehydrogenase PreA subunit
LIRPFSPNEDDFEKTSELYIDLVECIDRAACKPACPVQAIDPQSELL